MAAGHVGSNVASTVASAGDSMTEIQHMHSCLVKLPIAKSSVVCSACEQLHAMALQVRPLLEAIGRAVIDIGEHPEQGSVVKLVGNFYISSLIEIFAEGMALGEKSGVARETIAQVASSLFPGNIAPGLHAEPISLL